MPKTAKKQALDCREHEFAMVPLRADVYFKQPVTLSFCKGRQAAKNKGSNKRSKPNQESCHCFPVFNKDKNYATSTFILPEEKKTYIENQIKFKLEHEYRIKEHSDQKSEMLMPKPKTKQSYCNVCRVNYEDYLEHIRSEFHKTSVKKAVFSRHIKDLETKYDKINQCRNSISKSCYNADTTGSLSEQEGDNLGMPMKKVKRDISFASTICYPLAMSQMKEMPMGQIPFLDQAGYMKQAQQMPMGYFGFDLGQQNGTQSQNFQGAIMPSFNSFQYSQLAAMGCGMEPNMFFGFPMVYCNEINNLNYLPSTYFNIPMTISAQKIETIDNC